MRKIYGKGKKISTGEIKLHPENNLWLRDVWIFGRKAARLAINAVEDGSGSDGRAHMWRLASEAENSTVKTKFWCKGYNAEIRGENIEIMRGPEKILALGVERRKEEYRRIFFWLVRLFLDRVDEISKRDFNSKIIQWTKEVKFFLGPISWFFNCRYLFWVERASLKAWSNIFYEFQFYYHFIYDSLNKDLNTWSSLKTFLLKIILIYQQCFENL